MKTISQLDSNEYFVAATVADADPMQAGEFLLPAGAVDAKPPKTPDGKRSRWAGSKWTHEDMQEPELDDEQSEPVPDYPTEAMQNVSFEEILEALEKADLLSQEQKTRRKAANKAVAEFDRQMVRRSKRIEERKAARMAAK